MSDAIPWQFDRARRAERIRCAVCRTCRWDPEPGKGCVHGGPYDGFILPDGSKVRLDDLEKPTATE